MLNVRVYACVHAVLSPSTFTGEDCDGVFPVSLTLSYHMHRSTVPARRSPRYRQPSRMLRARQPSHEFIPGGLRPAAQHTVPSVRGQARTAYAGSLSTFWMGGSE